MTHERTVRHAFREAVETYCNLFNATGRDTRGLRVSVAVTTTRTLSQDTVRWIRRTAHDHVGHLLPGAAVHSIEFPVLAAVEEPGHRFAFRDTSAQDREHGAVAVLTLRYERHFVWSCRIGAAARWQAVGRLPGPGALPLPASAAWMPRGPLLLVRNHRDRLDFARSTSRLRYRIQVDGVDLDPGGTIAAAPTGEIRYRDTVPGSVTVLRYHVDWEGHHA